MSYVIQNYCFNQKINSQTPRLIAFMLFNNLRLFLLFIKYKLFFISFKVEKLFQLNIINRFAPHFYHHFYSNKIQTLNFNFMGFYDNNLSKSIVYWIIRVSKFFLFRQTLVFSNRVYLENTAPFNQYFLPVISINRALNLNKFKNFFYFNFFLLSFLWYQHNEKIKFHQNFIFAIETLFLLPIFSGYFFKIYKH